MPRLTKRGFKRQVGTMGVTSPSYRLFVLASVCLHAVLLFLVPKEWVMDMLGQEGTRPHGLSVSGSAEELEAWRQAPHMQVIDIELLRDADRPPAQPLEEAQLQVEDPVADRVEEWEVVDLLPEEVETSELEAPVPPPADPPAPGGAPAAAATSTTAHGVPGQAAGSPDAVVVPPVLEAWVVPDTPPEARRHRETQVKLRVHVTAAGVVSEVQVAEPTGCQPCEEEAVRTAHRLRWRPAMWGSTPVDAWVSYTVIFKR